MANKKSLQTLTVLLSLFVMLSEQNIITVNRKTNGDLIEVKTEKLPVCGDFLCKKYNAESVTTKLGLSCTCRCKGTILQETKTYYNQDSKCMAEEKIAEDNSCKVTANDALSKKSSFLSINPNSKESINLTLHNPVQDFASIKISWSYYKNKSWYPGMDDLFTIAWKKESLLSKKKWILKVSRNVPQNLNGLLLKVSLQYVYNDGFNPPDQCIMFKVLGYHTVSPLPTPQPEVTTQVIYTTKEHTTAWVDKVGTQTSAIVGPTTVSNYPNTDASKGDDKELLIALVIGAIALSITVVIGCVGFLLYNRYKRKKLKKGGSSRPQGSRPQPPNSPTHNYEYVVYPELSENSPQVNSIDNASYGRGPDNELIIRTPTVSIESLISKHTNNSSTKSNNSVNVTATLMTHNYADLQESTKNDNHNNSIYQPLIRQQETNDVPPSVLQDNEPGGSDEPFDYEVTPEYMELEPIKSHDTEV